MPQLRPQVFGVENRDGTELRGYKRILRNEEIGSPHGEHDASICNPDIVGNTGYQPHHHIQWFRLRRSFLQRAGKRSLCLAILSIISICAALGFLSWLWFSRQSDERWRRLVLGGWSNQAVTIASLTLRTALSVLAGIATSMIASVSLEYRGVTLHNALHLSVAQFTSPGPSTFWQEIFSQAQFVAMPLRVPLALLLLSTIGIQFSSTILLSDFGLGRVVGFPVNSANSTGFSWADANFGNNYTDEQSFRWSDDFKGHSVPFQSQQQYWSGESTSSHTFAEFWEPGITGQEIVDDTGRTLRALIPIDDQNIRNKLKTFAGLAPVLDTRVVCVRPDFVSGLLTDSTYNLTLRLPNLSDTVPGLITSRNNFVVELPRIIPRGGHGHALNPLDPSVGGLLSKLDASGHQDLDLTYELYEEKRAPTRFQGRVKTPGVWRTTDERACGVDLGNAYALMDTRGPFALNGGIYHDYPSNRRAMGGPGEGPWRRVDVEIFPGDPVTDPYVTLGLVTVCFDSLPKGAQYHHIQEFNITASSKGKRSEPRIGFKSRNETVDVKLLRTQLGSSAEQGLEERNLLRLDSINAIRNEVNRSSEQWENYCSAASDIEQDVGGNRYWNPNIYRRDTYSWIKEMALGKTRPIVLCTGNCLVRGNVNHIRSGRGLAWLIDETVRDKSSSSPALALRGTLTQVMRQTYYSWFSTLDYSSDLTTVALEKMLIPTQARGFWIVFSITFMQLALCFSAFVMFATLTRTSRLDNAWQAVAEVVHHKDSKRVFNEAGHMTDNEVKKWISKDPDLRQRFTVRQPGVEAS